MIILMTAALAAAQPMPATMPMEGHGKSMAMPAGQHEKMKCCDCCKDMAKEHDGHADHAGQSAN